MRLALRGMDSTKWQGIVQYWRVDTISTNSGGYGRSWWSFLHREEYPGLLGVARDHLGILGRQYRVHLSACLSNPGPATTIEVGRPFSQGGILLSHIQNRFTSQAINAVMCMVSWSHTGFVDLVNQAPEPTLRDEHSEEREDDEISTLQTVTRDFSFQSKHSECLH